MNDPARDAATDVSHADPTSYPTNRVIGSLDRSSVDAAIEELTAAGFAAGQIEVLTQGDVADLESPLDQHGVSGFLGRFILSLGADLAFIERARSELASGRELVLVAVMGDDEKARAGDVLRKQDSSLLVYVGKWTFEGLE